MLICNRYEPTGSMWAGGMSEARHCLDTRLNRPVILKILQSGVEAKRLEDEKNALLKIRSNHVVQLLDVVDFEYAGKTISCLVLEHIDGADLEEGKYEVDDKYLSVLWQIAKGVEEIHAAGMIHRDIKPNNIRQDAEGIIKIIDFGLSRGVGPDAKTMSAIGFVPYMAPELFSKPPIRFSTAADVYSFAVLALSISKAGLPACLNSLTPHVPPGLVAQHLGSIDEQLAEALQSCLAAEPNDRPSMRDIVEALERVLLRGRHRARVVIGGEVSEISAAKPVAQPKVSTRDKTVSGVKIRYDGNHFIVEEVIGEVKANNVVVNRGMRLPMSCVLAFRSITSSYLYATFDVSSPEFMP